MPSAYGGQSQQRWGDNTLSQGEYLRDFLLTDVAGNVCKTVDARRKGMLLLVFFRPSDPVSRKVIGAAQQIADAYGAAGKLTVIGISEEDEATTRSAAPGLEVKFPIVADHDLYHAMIYGVTAIPSTYLAGGDGRVLKRFAGYRGDTINEISAKIAMFSAVAGVAIDLDAYMPETPAPAPPPAPATA